MTIASPTVESRAQQLRNLINELVKVLDDNQGSMKLSEVVPSFASKTGLPQSEVPYIVNSAVADHRITADLRSGQLKVLRSA